MPFIEYVPKRFHPKSERLIGQVNAIIDEYRAIGLDLTLRQLYYQLVSADIIPNAFRAYKNLGELVSQARLAGRIDWNAIEDRTRNLQEWPSQYDPQSALANLARHYREDKWDDQPTHVEVWVEKDAMIGVIERACSKYQTPFFSCRGYTSQSEVWNSAQRLSSMACPIAQDYGQTKKPVVILHLGDHDPSGIDMTRDIQDRLDLFEAENVVVERIALNRDQIKKFNPPPNPAKMKDSRAADYVKKHGPKSWELDALKPEFIISLIEEATAEYLDGDKWEAACKKEEDNRARLHSLSENFSIASRFVANPDAMQLFRDNEEP